MSSNVVSLREYRLTNAYDRAFHWTLEHWVELVENAKCFMKHKPTTSIAEQIMRAKNVPYNVAEEIAMSIAISIATSSGVD